MPQSSLQNPAQESCRLYDMLCQPFNFPTSPSWSKYCVCCRSSIARGFSPSSTSELNALCSHQCRQTAKGICMEMYRHLPNLNYVDQCLGSFGDIPSRHLLNVVQKLLDLHTAPDQDRQFIRQILLRLSLEHDDVPAKLILHTVKRVDDEPFSEGGFGDVYRGVLHNKTVALKRLRIYGSESPKERERIIKTLHYEALTWQNLNHRNVLQCFGVAFGVFRHSPCIVSPWMPNGTIRDVLRRKEPGLKVKIPNWIYEISRGLEYLHCEGVIHGDLRGANILINDKLQVCLTDFGLAVLDGGASKACNSLRGGNPRWMAPELLRSDEGSVRPTYASDIFAFGCVIVELFTREAPYMGFTERQVTKMVPEGLRPTKQSVCSNSVMELPSLLWELCKKCWVLEPDQRPVVREVSVITSACYGEAKGSLSQQEWHELLAESTFTGASFGWSID